MYWVGTGWCWLGHIEDNMTYIPSLRPAFVIFVRQCPVATIKEDVMKATGGDGSFLVQIGLNLVSMPSFKLF